MTDLEFILAGWGLGLGVLALYAWTLVSRGRRLSARVPAERRRWMTDRSDAGREHDLP